MQDGWRHGKPDEDMEDHLNLPCVSLTVTFSFSIGLGFFNQVNQVYHNINSSEVVGPRY